MDYCVHLIIMIMSTYIFYNNYDCDEDYDDGVDTLNNTGDGGGSNGE